MDGSEQVGGAAEILDGEVEEQLLARLAAIELPADFRVVLFAVEMAWSKMVGLEVRPVTDNSSM